MFVLFSEYILSICICQAFISDLQHINRLTICDYIMKELCRYNPQLKHVRK